MFATTRHHPVATAFAGVALACAGALGIHAWQADAAPGDADTTFVPITPCRIVDTRPSFRINTFGALSAADTITVATRGTNGDCTLPTDAAGLSLNVTAVNPTQPTFLTIWPGGPLPNASSLNPFPGMPPTPNAVVTDLSDTGRFSVYNLDGVVEVVIDVNGYHTATSLRDLHDRVTALEAENTALAARVAALETLTSSMSIVTDDDQPTVRFSGVNVQVVDGTGDTWGDVNGRGNLIVGYNEADGSDLHTGSHNLVIGHYHTYTSHQGLVAGLDSTVTGPQASVTGGYGNTAHGLSSSITGGSGNTASGTYSSVTGGRDNTAATDFASVTGGRDNTAREHYTSVTGGWYNSANADYTSVTGGDGISCSINERGVCAEGFMLPID